MAYRVQSRTPSPDAPPSKQMLRRLSPLTTARRPFTPNRKANQMNENQSQRPRGGKRAARAKQASERRAARTGLIELLERAQTELGAEHDPAGVWGISDQGAALLEELGTELEARIGAERSAGERERLARAQRRLGDFWAELESFSGEYVSERAERFLDEARAELAD